MKITNNQVFGAQNYLSQLDLSKFEKEVRVAIYKNVGELNAAVKAVQDKMETSKKELFKDLDEEAAKVAELRGEFNKEGVTEERKAEIIKELESYTAYFEKEREFIEVTNQFGNDEIEISPSMIDFNKFVDGLIESGQKFTAGQLQTLSFIFNKVK